MDMLLFIDMELAYSSWKTLYPTPLCYTEIQVEGRCASLLIKWKKGCWKEESFWELLFPGRRVLGNTEDEDLQTDSFKLSCI
jgi:hypothetical protein